ncbi:MAG: hypothetical protein JWQ10_2102 [Herbaspirillum sp.]|nr:hypothetical protein [Herbaspirillum sp.]
MSKRSFLVLRCFIATSLCLLLTRLGKCKRKRRFTGTIHENECRAGLFLNRKFASNYPDRPPTVAHAKITGLRVPLLYIERDLSR